MDFESFDEEDEEAFPRKRPRSVYENQRSSTPVREAPPSPAAPLVEEEDERGEGVVKEDEEDSVPDAKRRNMPADTDGDADEEGPDYFGLSHEDMESFIEEVEAEEQEDGEGPQARWEELPVEVWQLIFQRVPLLDLVTSGRRVCQRWNQIITDDSFLHWKKLYFQLKYCDPNTESTVTTMLRPLSGSSTCPEPNGPLFIQAGQLINTTPNYTLVQLARMFGEKFGHLGINVESVLSVMSRHPQYGCVVQIKEQLLADNGPDLGVLERLLLLVACCTSVHQVLLLIDLLCGPVSGGFSPPALGYREMSEMFHAMATFFLFLWNSGSLPPRFHYNVFYSLDVIHRSTFVPSLCHQPLLPSLSQHSPLFNGQGFPLSPQLSFGVSSSQESQTDCAVTYGNSDMYCEARDVAMTSEQARVVVHPIRKGETIKVIAFAGTGKTTTLVQFARRNYHLRIGYCVYNKSVQENAEKVVFSELRNVRCKTFHSLAYEYVGESYKAKAKGKRKFENLSTYSVSDYISDPPKMAGLNTKQSLYSFAKYIKGTLENFWASTDREITRIHIPRFRHSDAVRVISNLLDCTMENSGAETDDEHYVARVLEETRKVWKKMKDLHDSSILMTHDGYLKLFQLSPSDFADDKGWDVLMIDEAQDLSPATIDLVMQTSCSKIFVGDPHQQIYSFRGATDALPLVRADHTFYLTRSFRFGPEIAYVSALLLRTLKGVRQQTLVGSEEEGCVFGTRKFRQVAIIARTNLGLFEEMARVLRSPEAKKKKLGFVGGIDSYDFSSLEAIYFLLQGNRWEARARKYSIGNRFASFSELQTYAEHSCDIQLQLKSKICLNHATDLITIIQQLKKQNVKDLSFADVIFTTAHKSKGLQFDNVMMADDFLPNFDLLDVLRLPADERNLMYVAATRAKAQLILSPTCVSVLKKSREHFVYPTASQTMPSQSETQVADSCSVCRSPFSDTCTQPRLKLYQPAIKLSTGVSAVVGPREGVVCRHCGYRTLPSFSFSF